MWNIKSAVFYTQHKRTPDAHKISDTKNIILCVPVYTEGGRELSGRLVINTHKMWGLGGQTYLTPQEKIPFNHVTEVN